MKFLETNKITFTQIKTAIENWLVTTYSQANSVFTKASPFGQIISAIEELSQLIFFYIEDAIVELNIFTASKQRSIYGWARMTGHNPTRSLSAQGTINLKIKSGADVPLNSSYLMILDKTPLTCINNNKKYFLNIGNDIGNLKINLNSNEVVPVRIVQGEIETQSLRGNGNPLQSFTLNSKGVIENEMVWVTVNGDNYEIVDSLYDMTKDSKSCLVKTGISDGIDIYFGNEDYGTIPANGSTINVTYVKTDGFEGNINSKSNLVNFKFNESGYTNTGEEVDLNEVFDIRIEKPIILGADSEPIEVTKLIAPKASRSYVLANPDNYVNLLSRFNYSYVDAYNTHNDEYIADDNVVYLFLIPDIERRLLNSTDYFTTPVTNFYLDEDEKNALINYIDMSGQQIISSEIQIVDPIIKKYVMNVYLRIYDSIDQTTLKNTIISKITDYLLRVKRRDKIPKSDIISLIEGITGVDSVNISFVSEDNEKAINDTYYIKTSTSVDRITGTTITTQSQVNLSTNEDPNLGLDDFGDVSIGLNELPIIRGGFYDRFSNYYDEGIDQNQYSSVNLIVKEVIRESTAIKLRNANKNSL